MTPIEEFDTFKPNDFCLNLPYMFLAMSGEDNYVIYPTIFYSFDNILQLG